MPGDNHRHHAPSLTFFDTATGRHLLRHGARNGTPWMRCVPATAATTVHELQRALRRLDGAFVR